MSRRKIHLLRALVHGILAGLAMLALGSLHMALAQSPSNTPSAASRLQASPLTLGLQQQLVLVNKLQTPVETPRVVQLPARAPLPLPAAPASPRWQAEVNPVMLLTALRQTLAAPAALAAQPQPPVPMLTADLLEAPLSVPAPRPVAPATSAPAASLPPLPMAMPVDLSLTTHHSLVVESPVRLKRVSITDDSIAQAVVVSPNQVLLQGKAPGEVSLLLWDADSNARAYTVRVQLDPQPLQAELGRLFPHDQLGVTSSGDALVVTGTLPNAATAKQVLNVADGFSKNIVNNLSVDTPTDPGQVLLQVRFAEIDRSAVAQFGANLLSTGAGKTVGALGTGQFGGGINATAPPPTQSSSSGSSIQASQGNLNDGAKFALGDLLNVFLFRSDANLGLTLQALQQRNLLQILAEPNLLAMDGKEASFLAGGEFPFPVVEGQGAINNVTIQFKPFGVNLHFKPTILPDGTIDLQVAPEVSALDFSNALTVSGFVIPALSTRRASTELELHDGQSFVIAGLMDNRVTRNMSKLPGLGDIPILGKFFQSWNTNKSRTELLVVVTAHLVQPSNTPPPPLKMAEPFLNPSKFDGKGGGK